MGGIEPSDQIGVHLAIHLDTADFDAFPLVVGGASLLVAGIGISEIGG